MGETITIQGKAENAAQEALEQEFRMNERFYEPSPGQTPSHVAHRVMRIAVDAYKRKLWEARRDQPREKLLADLSFICAREIKAFGDLTPMEVEALLRGGWS